MYGLKEYTGEMYCYITRYLEYYCFFVYQYHTFFINLYRYICVVHSEKMRENNINIKVVNINSHFYWTVQWFPNAYPKNPTKTQLSDIFKAFLSKFFSKKIAKCLTREQSKSCLKYGGKIRLLSTYRVAPLILSIFCNKNRNKNLWST